MLMKRLMNWRPLVKSLFLLITRSWRDDEKIFLCFITEYNIFQLDPLLPSLLSYLHKSTIFYKYVEIL